MQSHITALVDKLIMLIELELPEMLTGGYLMERAGMVLNGAVYRRLSLVLMDVSNIKLTTLTARLLQRFPDLRRGTARQVL